MPPEIIEPKILPILDKFLDKVEVFSPEERKDMIRIFKELSLPRIVAVPMSVNPDKFQ